VASATVSLGIGGLVKPLFLVCSIARIPVTSCHGQSTTTTVRSSAAA